MSFTKTDERIEMPFGLWNPVGPKNHVLGPDHHPGSGAVWQRRLRRGHSSTFFDRLFCVTDSTDIVDGKMKLILGLIWTLILHYSISMPMWDGDELGGGLPQDRTPKQRLLDWIQSRVPDKPINNFTTDWNDGTSVGALVDAVAPGIIHPVPN